MMVMLLERYGYKVDPSYQQYAFQSEGPNGLITKVVYYQYMLTVDYIDYYNLAFGDMNKQTGKLSTLTVSNNMDRNKILATVAVTAFEFSDHFPGSRIYAKGITPSRTRLYQMGIAANLEEINGNFLIKGEHAERDGRLLKREPIIWPSRPLTQNMGSLTNKKGGIMGKTSKPNGENKKTYTIGDRSGISVDKSMKDYSNDPFFVKNWPMPNVLLTKVVWLKRKTEILRNN